MDYKFGVISADSHMTITNEEFLPHVPKEHRTAAKEFLAAHTGNPIGSSGTAQASEAERFWPAMGRVGQYDPVERMKDMDLDGIDVEILYTQGDAYMMPAGDPPALDGMALLGFPDKDALFPLVRAYNDALAEWIDIGAGRLYPVGIVPLLPIADAVAEIRRLATAASVACAFRPSPQLVSARSGTRHGAPSGKPPWNVPNPCTCTWVPASRVSRTLKSTTGPTAVQVTAPDHDGPGPRELRAVRPGQDFS